MSEILHRGWLYTRGEPREKFAPYTLSTNIYTPTKELFCDKIENDLAKKPGLVVTGSQFQYNGNLYVADNYAEAFNDINNNQAIGKYSHAEGTMTTAYGAASHAEGEETKAGGKNSHAEGLMTKAVGENSHAEGTETNVTGQSGHSEGYKTSVEQAYGHAEGSNTKVTGTAGHAEGYMSKASSDYAHAEGESTTASGKGSHAEGYLTTASGANSHAAGQYSVASGDASYAGGLESEARGVSSHAFGWWCQARGDYSKADGVNCAAYGQGSVAEGNNNIAYRKYSHVMGEYATMDDEEQFIFQIGNGTGSSGRSNAFTVTPGGAGDFKSNLSVGGSIKAHGSITMDRDKKVASEAWTNNTKPGLKVSGKAFKPTISYGAITLNNGTEFNNNTEQKYYYDAENEKYVPCTTFQSGITTYYINNAPSQSAGSGAEIFNDYRERTYTENGMTASWHGLTNQPVGNIAIGANSHAEGFGTTAIGSECHAEGQWTFAGGVNSHTEGQCSSTNYCNGAHAEGVMTFAGGDEGISETLQALVYGPHAEGYRTKAIGQVSHAEGYETEAYDGAHAEGYRTIAYDEQHVQGRYNIADETSTYAHIVGGGTSNANRKNIHTIDWNGNAMFAGSLTVGQNSYGDTDPNSANIAGVPGQLYFVIV